MLTKDDIYSAIAEYRDEYVCARDMHVVLVDSQNIEDVTGYANSDNGAVYINTKTCLKYIFDINGIKSLLLHEDLGHLAMDHYLLSKKEKITIYSALINDPKFLKLLKSLKLEYHYDLQNINEKGKNNITKFLHVGEYIAFWCERYNFSNPLQPNYSLIEKIKMRLFPLKDTHEVLKDKFWKYKTTYITRPKHWIKGGIEEKNISNNDLTLTITDSKTLRIDTSTLTGG